MRRIRYGSESHYPIRLQYEQAPPDYRRTMAEFWTDDPDGTIDQIVKSIQDSQEYACADCGVQRGQLHEPGCDLEECPVCHLQRIGCEHEVT